MGILCSYFHVKYRQELRAGFYFIPEITDNFKSLFLMYLAIYPHLPVIFQEL